MLRKNRLIYISLFLLMGASLSLGIRAQGVDTTYSPVPGPGVVAIKSVALEGDGKAIVSGPFQTINGSARVSIARLNTDGSLDTSLDPGTGFNGDVTKLIVQSDGKILAFGTFTTYNSTARAKLARINSDGSLDTSFAPDITNVNNINLQPDGKIILLGSVITVNTVSRTGIARLNSDGTLDTSFTITLGSPNLHDCVVHADGRITFVGSYDGFNGSNRINSARVFSDGSLDTTFNGGVQVFHRIALEADGKYIVASTIPQLPVWRLNADGTLDNTFNAGTVKSGGVENIIVKADNTIILAGSFTTPQQGILRMDQAGNRDVQFAVPGANAAVNGIAVQTDDKVIAVGAFTSIAGAAKPGIARINSSNFAARTPFDFDGDGRADISVTRESDFMWYQLTGPSYFYSATQLGATGNKIVPADYDGDGKTDISVFDPNIGRWKYLASGNHTLITKDMSLGTVDFALPADYTGDGRADYAIVRNYQWLIVDIATNQFVPSFNTTGQPGDQPMTGDFDGDRKADKALYRPSTGDWIYYPSSNGGGIQFVLHWGNSSDIPVPADYDGDGKTDFAVFRTTDGNWYVLNSSNGSYTGVHFGLGTDRPIPADYDGDGKTDIAVFRPSEGFWYLLLTTGGYTGLPWGIATDIPTPAAFLPPAPPPRNSRLTTPDSRLLPRSYGRASPSKISSRRPG